MDSRLSLRPAIPRPFQDEPLGLYWPVLGEQPPRPDDECDSPDTVPLTATDTSSNIRPGLSNMTTGLIENEIRAARQVIADSTTQRNVVLEFLLHLQTAQRELAGETELVTRQLPSLRFRVSEPTPQIATQAAPPEQPIVHPINSLQASVLSRLTRLSQRTREVMEDLDRRRHAAGMARLSPRPDDAAARQAQNVDGQSVEKVQRLKPMRKVRLEERLLVEWRPHDYGPGRARLPARYDARQVVARSADRELISR